MQRFRVRFSRNPVIVLVLLLLPLVSAAVFLSPLVVYPNTPQWVVIITIVVMMSASIIAVRLVVNRWAVVPAEVELDARGIRIRLIGKPPLYPRREYASTWEGLDNVSSNIDPRLGERYYQLRFRQLSTTVNLAPVDPSPIEGETALGDALLKYVSQYNVRHPEKPVRQQGFYETWWARALTILVYLMLAATVVMRIFVPARVSNWQMAQLAVVAVLWLWVYYSNQRKRS